MVANGDAKWDILVKGEVEGFRDKEGKSKQNNLEPLTHLEVHDLDPLTHLEVLNLEPLTQLEALNLDPLTLSQRPVAQGFQLQKLF